MKTCFLLFSCFIINTSFEQTISSLTETVSKDVCDCFSQKRVHDSLRIPTWKTCLLNSIIDRKKLLLKTAFHVYGDTSSATGSKIAAELMEQMQRILINDCNSYYAAIIKGRAAVFNHYFDVNADSLQEVISNLEKNTKKDVRFYKYRGFDYMCLKDFEKAKKDLDYVNQLEKNSLYATYLNAQIFEYLEDYDNSIRLYEELEKRLRGGGYYKEIALMLTRKKNNTSTLKTAASVTKEKLLAIETTSGSNIVPVKRKNGVYAVPVELNGVLKIDFIFDSGASDVSISPDIALTLLKTETIEEDDWLEGRYYKFADGSTAKSTRFNLRSLKIGNKILHNVTCSISNSLDAPMLLGQSCLGRLGKYSFDNANQILIIE